MKKLKSYSSLTIVFSLFFLLSSFVPLTEFDQRATEDLGVEWELYTSVDGVNVYCKIGECCDDANGLKYRSVLLKLENTGSVPVKLEFNKALWSGGVMTHDGSSEETQASFELQANAVQEGACGTSNALWIYVQDLVHEGGSVVSHFALTGLRVSAL